MATTSSKTTVRKPARRSRRNSSEHLNKALDRAIEGVVDDYYRMLTGYKIDKLHELVLRRVEKKLLEHVLQLANFNQAHAAGMLGISRSTLRTKTRAYGIPVKQKKTAAAARGKN